MDTKDISHQSRVQGTMLGLSIGDAIGTTLEFSPPGSFEPISDMIGGGPFKLKPGQWTDDTSMALCLAHSLIESKGFDPLDQIKRYCRWYREGYLSSTGACFDIGGTTQFALETFGKTGNPLSGPTDERSAGNGSLMRLAPVPLCFASDPNNAIEYSGESSKTTHQSPIAVDACRYFGGLIVGAIMGTSKEEILSSRYSPVPDYWNRNSLSGKIEEVASGSFKEKQPPDIIGSGYVVKTLEAVLWAFNQSENFRDGLLKVVNLGDDADTTGAVYGQLAGAFYGLDGIPEEWVKKVYMCEDILKISNKLYAQSGL